MIIPKNLLQDTDNTNWTYFVIIQAKHKRNICFVKMNVSVKSLLSSDVDEMYDLEKVYYDKINI